jgi:hypothetical protein
MERQILFRGKRVDNGEWVEGSLSMVDSRSQKIGKKYGQMFICQVQTSWHNTDNGKLVGYWIEVFPETVGQFINSNDRTGNVKVFTDDLLKEPSGMILRVVYHEDQFQYMGVNRNGELFALNMGILERVGNIYDNPELLK